MKINSEIIIIFNALLYLFTFLFYYKKQEKFNVGSHLLLIWSISTLVSIYFFYTGIRIYKNIEILPFLYLYSLVLLSFFPILKFKSDKIQKIEVDDNFIFIITVIIILISIEPFIENSILFIRSLQENASSYIADVYNAQAQGADYLAKQINDEMSWLGRKFNIINIVISGFTPILLFYHLTLKKKNKIIILGLIVASLNPMVNAYIHASRVVIVSNVLYILFLFILFKDVMDPKTTKGIKIYGGGALAIISSLGILITIYRFQDLSISSLKSFSIFDWVSLYIGEGTLNFNEQMWHIRETMGGDNSFSLFKYLTGNDTFLDYLDRRMYWQPRTGIDGNIFYTHIGDFFGDLGGIGTIIFVVVIVIILLKLLKFKQRVPFHRIVLFSLWYKICMMGFTYYTFKVSSQSIQILAILFIYFILYSNYSFNSKKS